MDDKFVFVLTYIFKRIRKKKKLLHNHAVQLLSMKTYIA